MTEHAAGLRFDIYERVHLSEDLEGIESLDEIELTPNIAVEVRGDQTVLTGHLLLSGSYSGVQSEMRKSLNHRIPVEITMPSERIADPEHVGVGIDQFDFDLLSTRTLNVTGVLSLQGVERAITHAGGDSKPFQRDEVLIVHEARKQEVQPEGTATAERQVEDTAVTASERSDDAFATGTGTADDKPHKITDEAGDERVEPAQELSVKPSAEEAAGQTQEPGQEDRVGEQTEGSEKTEETMKISFAGTPAADQDEWADRPEDAAEPASDNEEQGERDTVSGAKWKKLFLSQEESTPQFRTVRMCIVQKEETLDTIAARYELNPREILLYNRLREEYPLSEGQVLYIPGS